MLIKFQRPDKEPYRALATAAAHEIARFSIVCLLHLYGQPPILTKVVYVQELFVALPRKDGLQRDLILAVVRIVFIHGLLM